MSESFEMLQMQVNGIKQQMDKVEVTLRDIQKSLTELLKFEVEHTYTKQALARAFVEIEAQKISLKSLDSRLAQVEIVMPPLQESRRWFLGGLSVILVLVVVGVVTYTYNGRAVQVGNSVVKLP